MDLFESQLAELCEVFSNHSRDKIKKLLELHQDKADAVNIVTEILLNEQDDELVNEISEIAKLGAIIDEDEDDDFFVKVSSNKRKAWWNDDDTQISKKIGKTGEIVFVSQSNNYYEDKDKDTDEEEDEEEEDYSVPSLRYTSQFWCGNKTQSQDPNHQQPPPAPLGALSSTEDCLVRLKEIFPDHNESVLRWCLTEAERELKGIGTATRTRKIKSNLFERATNLVLQHSEANPEEDQEEEDDEEERQEEKIPFLVPVKIDVEGEEEEEDEDFDPDANSEEEDPTQRDEEEELEHQSDEEEADGDDDEEEEDSDDSDHNSPGSMVDRILEETIDQMVQEMGSTKGSSSQAPTVTTTIALATDHNTVQDTIVGDPQSQSTERKRDEG